MAGNQGVLAGIRVVEFAQNIAVPQCGRLLAGMGADVVKVEPPAGDAMRHLGPLAPNEAKAYAVVNPGKRSIAVDLASAEAASVVDRLFGWADVALVGFKLDDLERYGIDWEHARSVNPRLVYMVGNAFGPEGEDAAAPGYDVLAQARSGMGFMMNRTSGGVPRASRPAINDTGTGIVGALGVVAALRHRDQTGEGQRVDASLLGTALSLSCPTVHRFEVDVDDERQVRADVEAARAGGANFEEVRSLYETKRRTSGAAFSLYFRPYATADGMIAVAGLSRGLFAKFHEATGVPAPVRPGSGEAGPSIDEVIERAEAVFRERTTADWMSQLRGLGYPCGPYNMPYDAVDDPQIRANDYIEDFDHPVLGRYCAAGMPVRFGAAPAPKLGASPALGEHRDEVLAELGFSAEEIDALVSASTV